jgi:hypothetical protein
MKYHVYCVIILIISGFSCSANFENLEKYINHSFLDKLKKENIEYQFCEQDLENIYSNDSIGINDFIGHLICSEGCFNKTSLMEDYFGFSFLNEKEQINLDHLPATILQFKYVPKSKRISYLKTSLNYFHSNGDINKCYSVSLFFSTLFTIRESEYTNLEEYSGILVSLYSDFVVYDYFIADLVLDLCRKSDCEEMRTFKNGKTFLSREFNSENMKNNYESIGDNNFYKYLK